MIGATLDGEVEIKVDNIRAKCRTPNRQFGVSGGVVSWDTSQEFGSSPPVRAFAKPRPHKATEPLGASFEGSALHKRE
ncbi:MAG: hypothetical protein FWD66_01540 [Paludibacter sp.]|nr:hypothetical protein [Paludibacter sp.]